MLFKMFHDIYTTFTFFTDRQGRQNGPNEHRGKSGRSDNRDKKKMTVLVKGSFCSSCYVLRLEINLTTPSPKKSIQRDRQQENVGVAISGVSNNGKHRGLCLYLYFYHRQVI